MRRGAGEGAVGELGHCVKTEREDKEALAAEVGGYVEEGFGGFLDDCLGQAICCRGVYA